MPGENRVLDEEYLVEAIESGPVGFYLFVMDWDLPWAGGEARLEVAGDTAKELFDRMVAGDDAVPGFSEASFYVDRELSYFQETAPGTEFDGFAPVDEGEAFELVRPEATLRFEYKEEHGEAIPLETYTHAFTVMFPVMDAYLTRSYDVYECDRQESE